MWRWYRVAKYMVSCSGKFTPCTHTNINTCIICPFSRRRPNPAFFTFFTVYLQESAKCASPAGAGVRGAGADALPAGAAALAAGTRSLRGLPVEAAVGEESAVGIRDCDPFV